MPHDLSDIICNVPSFLTKLSLFPNTSNFRDVLAFIHTFLKDQQVATNPFNRQQDSQQSSYNDCPAHLGPSSLIAFTCSPLVNGFGNPTTGILPRSSLVARHLISAALQHHASLSAKVTNSDDPDLQPTNIILEHLPPADMFLNYLWSAFPMAALPTTEQLNKAPQPMNPATTLAVNFVIYQDLSTNHLEQIDIPDGNSQYFSIKSHLILISTNTYNYSINFLPNHEYQLFRVVKTIDVIDPQCVLPQTPEPTLLEFQLKCLSQRKKHTPSLSSMIQAISPPSLITKMALLNPTLQPQFNTYSRHKPSPLWMQLMKQMNGHVLTIPANSGANLTLSIS
jgi:hypothetical protein